MPGPTAGSDQLWTELAAAREALAAVTAERDAVRQRHDELEQAYRRTCDELVEATEHENDLVQLYAALLQIHGAASMEELLQAIQEVVINIIGSEELAVLEVRDGALRLLRSYGIDPDPYQAVPLGQGALGRVAQTGKLHRSDLDGAPPGEERLTGCIPLRFGGQVVGVVAFWRLLDHKPTLLPSDQEVFDLLTSHGGQALTFRRWVERGP